MDECVLLGYELDMFPLHAETKRMLMGMPHLIQVMVKSGLGRAHPKKMMKNEMKWIHLHAIAPELCSRIASSLHRVLDKACILMEFMV
jgi:hypothetical protein